MPLYPVMKQRIALVGFGVVGQAVCDVLLKKSETLASEHGFSCGVVAVSDLRWGTVHDPDGLDLARLLDDVREHGRFTNHAKNWDALTMIRECGADAVAELAYTDLETGEPAISHCRAALAAGMSVVTSNKGPPALAHRDLTALAAANGAQFLYEGTVMSGTPVFNLWKNCLAGNEIREFRGILNGTTNYILGEMEAGTNYARALAQAQAAGYAEADPEADVDGHDALAKVIILANTMMGGDFTPADVPCEGIAGLRADDVEQAGREGRRYKLVGSARKEDGRIDARVGLERLPLDDPLAAIGGVANALTLATDLLGEVTVVGPGAGPIATGYAIVADLLRLNDETS